MTYWETLKLIYERTILFGLSTQAHMLDRAICRKLLRERMISRVADGFYISTEGEQLYLELQSRIAILGGKEQHKWIDEARTGITIAGKPTAIDNAAIPKATKNQYSDDKTNFDRSLQIAEIARRLDLPDDIVRNALNRGEIHYCGRCKQYNKFARRGIHGWQSICQQCQKKRSE